MVIGLVRCTIRICHLTSCRHRQRDSKSNLISATLNSESPSNSFELRYVVFLVVHGKINAHKNDGLKDNQVLIQERNMDYWLDNQREESGRLAQDPPP